MRVRVGLTETKLSVQVLARWLSYHYWPRAACRLHAGAK